MRARDILIVAAVVLVGGFAVADALREDSEEAASPTVATGRSTQPSAPSETGPVETIEGVRVGLLAGRLVYTGAGCELKEVDLGSGVGLSVGAGPSTCDLVSAPRSLALAVSLPSARRNVVPYRVVDLQRLEDLASFQARVGSVVWSPDGQRVGWCEPSGRGQALELGRGEPRQLGYCPLGFTPGGAPLHRRGRLLLAGDRPLVETSSPVEAVSFAAWASLAVRTELGRVVIFGRGEGGFRPEYVTSLPAELRELPILFSPTHCHASLSSAAFPPTVYVVDLRPCPGSRAPTAFAGRATAWSPNGTWLAVAERDRVAIHPVLDQGPAVVLSIAASDLAWKG